MSKFLLSSQRKKYLGEANNNNNKAPNDATTPAQLVAASSTGTMDTAGSVDDHRQPQRGDSSGDDDGDSGVHTDEEPDHVAGHRNMSESIDPVSDLSLSSRDIRY